MNGAFVGSCMAICCHEVGGAGGSGMTIFTERYAECSSLERLAIDEYPSAA